MVKYSKQDKLRSVEHGVCPLSNPIQWLRSSSNLDRSRFVGRDRSSLVKKNAQIFLVVVGVVI